jgi:hypothetical protein
MGYLAVDPIFDRYRSDERFKARSMLREIRVQSKQELIERIHLYFQEVNAAPVVFRWKYKMDEVSID